MTAKTHASIVRAINSLRLDIEDAFTADSLGENKAQTLLKEIERMSVFVETKEMP